MDMPESHTWSVAANGEFEILDAAYDRPTFAQALRRLALRDEVKQALLASPLLYEILSVAARAYVAGEHRADALARVATLHASGVHATVDYMGENTQDAKDARAATAEFLRLSVDLSRGAPRSSISLDLSHIVLGVSSQMALDNLTSIAEAAHAAGREVMISMEESAKTDRILTIYREASRRSPNLGITLQACLTRTAADLEQALELPGRIRLVKGAYHETFGRVGEKRDVDAAYRSLMERLIASNHAASIATHDPELLSVACSLLGTGAAAQPAELELLDGAATHVVPRLRHEGYAVRVYVVYGREWYLYFLHRLAEHPPGLFQAIPRAIAAYESRLS